MCRRSIPEMEPRNTPETTNKKEKIKHRASHLFNITCPPTVTVS